MIIKYIENRNGFWFFSKDRVTVITDEGEGSIAGNIDEKAVRELNLKLKDYNVASKEDFIKLKNICGENYKIVEECLINSSKKFWLVLNESANMIPRPMALVLRKDSGIREFYLLSLNCGDFQQACFVNSQIFEILSSKLNGLGFSPDEKGFYHTLEDRKVLDILQDAIKEVSSSITFNIRICVNFKNSKGETLKEKPVDFITNMVFNDNILVAINPIDFSDKASYEKLKEKVVGDCYLAVENLEGFDDKKADFVCLKQVDLPHVISISKIAKEKNFNIIFDGGADVCVGFGFPILKIDLRSKEAEKKISRVFNILEEIKEHRGVKKENENVNPVKQ